MKKIGLILVVLSDVLRKQKRRINMTTRMCLVFAILLMCVFGCSGDSMLGPGGQQEGFVTNGNIKIRYKLDLPEGDGPFPAVVYGPGSGNISADFRTIVADTKKLLELGFAVMRYDKRGTGESDGEVVGVSLANSPVTIPLLAADMNAVLQQLLQMPEIDTDRVGLFGVSQAYWYMPLVAESAAEVGFMIVLTGGVMPVGLNIRYEMLSLIEGRSIEESQQLLEGYSGELGFDPRPHLRALDIPMLYLLGEQDPNVPFRVNRDGIELLKQEGKDITLLSYANGVHVLEGIDFWPDVDQWLGSEMIY